MKLDPNSAVIWAQHLKSVVPHYHSGDLQFDFQLMWTADTVTKWFHKMLPFHIIFTHLPKRSFFCDFLQCASNLVFPISKSIINHGTQLKNSRFLLPAVFTVIQSLHLLYLMMMNDYSWVQKTANKKYIDVYLYRYRQMLTYDHQCLLY